MPLKHASLTGVPGRSASSLAEKQRQNRLDCGGHRYRVPPDLDFRSTQSLGLQLVGMLVEQLDAPSTWSEMVGPPFTSSSPSSATQRGFEIVDTLVPTLCVGTRLPDALRPPQPPLVPTLCVGTSPGRSASPTAPLVPTLCVELPRTLWRPHSPHSFPRSAWEPPQDALRPHSQVAVRRDLALPPQLRYNIIPRAGS